MAIGEVGDSGLHAWVIAQNQGFVLVLTRRPKMEELTALEKGRKKQPVPMVLVVSYSNLKRRCTVKYMSIQKESIENILLLVIAGKWAHWGSWTSCKSNCRKSRIRTCTNPAPKNGGADCIGKGNEETTCTDGYCGKFKQPRKMFSRSFH